KPPSTPFRTSAAASVSPSRPSYSAPANVHLMGQGVALELEEAAAAEGVHPALDEAALRVVAVEEELRPLLVRERGRVGRVAHAGLSPVGELDLVALAAPRTRDPEHQCATPAAPCSSTRAPVTKRSSENGATRACGSPCAIVQANVRPDAGVALNPPVPQPQFT